MGRNTPVDSVSDLDQWALIPHPVVVVDRAGVIRALSASARTLVKTLAVGGSLERDAPPWLWHAHEHFFGIATTAEPVQVCGSVEERLLAARPVCLPTGDIAWWLMDEPAHLLRESQEALAREQERAALLDETSAVLMAMLNVERCMEAAATLAAEHLADAAVVVAPFTGRHLDLVSCGVDGATQTSRVDADPAAVPGLGEALSGFPPVPSRWLDAATLPEWLLPQDCPDRVGSVVITAMPGYGAPAGALVLLRGATRGAMTEADERFARLFAARAGAALSAARLYAEQAAITRTLMHNLLPPQLGRLPGIGLAGGYRASDDHQMVGGDFYDVHPASTPDGETLVLLGDVCGKGVEAAVLTGKVRNTLQALAPLAGDHAAVLTLLNNALLSADHTRFVTLVLASVAQRDGDVALRLTSAGHMPPLIVRNHGGVEEADTQGMLVGVVPDITSRTFETSLAPGETCLLYTDGVTEARGGPLGTEMFGEQRLAAELAHCAGMPAEAVVERIMMLTSQWLGRRAHDDIAVVAITAPRRTRLSAVDGHTAGRFIA